MINKSLTVELISFLIDNPRALCDIGDDAMLKSAARYMVDSRLTASQIMVRVREASDPSVVLSEVLRAATSLSTEARMTEILRAFCAIKTSVWTDLDVEVDVDMLIASLPNHSTFVEWLLTNHMNDQIDENNPLYLKQGLISDDYWGDRVRRYIATSDFHRAWDELCKARRGIASEGTINAARENGKKFQITTRYFMATVQLVGELAAELHDRMVNAGVLPPLTPASHTVFGNSIASTGYDTKIGVRKPRATKITIPRPGLRMASDFLDQEATDALRKSDDKEGRFRDGSPYVYTTPGIAIISIALHFHARENARKRAKHDDALASYKATHPVAVVL